MQFGGVHCYDEYLRVCTQPVGETTTVAASAPSSAPSEAGSESKSDNVYTYAAAKDPPPQQVPANALDVLCVDLRVLPFKTIAYAYFPQYAYAYPQQHVTLSPIKEKHEEHGGYHIVSSDSHTKTCEPVATPATMSYGFAYTPIAVATPTQPVPMHCLPDTGAKVKEGKKAWVGRTKKEVDEDNRVIATREGAYKPVDIVPKNPTPDQVFWVCEVDGSHTLRTFQTIEEELYPGKWKLDHRYGNCFFVREKPKKGKK